MSCDHVFDVPLCYQDPATGEWTTVVVGFSCSKCWFQLFDGESVTWTTSANTTQYLQWVA